MLTRTALLAVSHWTRRFWVTLACATVSGCEGERVDPGSENIADAATPRAAFVADPELPEITIPDEPLCPSCGITARVLFTIGETDGPGILEGLGRVTLDGLGRVWHSHNTRGPKIFHQDGTFFRLLGPQGRGPGEFLVGYPVNQLPGDSILVFDSRARRAAVLGPDMGVARYIGLQAFPSDAVVLEWPSLVMIRGNVGGPESNGLALHAIDMSGAEASVIASFGPRGQFGVADGYDIGRSLEGFVWSVRPENYQIGLWDTSGQRVRSWVREADWFDNEGNLRHSATDPVEDAVGRLWIRINTPRPDAEEVWQANFRRQFPNGAGSSGVVEMSVDELPPAQDLYRTTLEVLDMTQGRVYARALLDAYIIALLPGNRAASYSEDDLGVPRVSILELQLEEPR